jgi:hypothetical protein
MARLPRVGNAQRLICIVTECQPVCIDYGILCRSVEVKIYPVSRDEYLYAYVSRLPLTKSVAGYISDSLQVVCEMFVPGECRLPMEDPVRTPKKVS